MKGNRYYNLHEIYSFIEPTIVWWHMTTNTPDNILSQLRIYKSWRKIYIYMSYVIKRHINIRSENYSCDSEYRFKLRSAL